MNFLEVVEKAFKEEKRFKRKDWYVWVEFDSNELDHFIREHSGKPYNPMLSDILATDWELIELVKTEKELLEDLIKKITKLEASVAELQYVGYNTPYKEES